MLRVFPSKQFHFSADAVIVNPIEYGDVFGLILSQSNLQPIAFVEKATLPDVLPRFYCELAMDAIRCLFKPYSGELPNIRDKVTMTSAKSNFTFLARESFAL